MRVLVLHNRYRQLGGEDRAVDAETAMLRAHGIDVVSHQADNEGSFVQLARHASWSEPSYQAVERLCRELRPDVAHVHNFWASLTPAVHGACHAAGVPTVQSLHNYRLFCVNALLLRNGALCTDCLGHSPWRGMLRRCYNDSAAASAVVANMIASNRRWNTWSEVDAFIAPSEHARSLFIRGGIDGERLRVKPNFAEDPGPAVRPPSACRTIVYAGRLSPEKGLRTLLSAWAAIKNGAGLKLSIIGDGPEAEYLRRHAGANVELLGRQSSDAVASAIKNARAVMAPSICFETFGNSIVEAYACGRPVIASDIGASTELVIEGRTGLKFEAGNVSALAEAIRRIGADPALADDMGSNARAEYLSRFTPGRNFEMLMAIYDQAIARRAGSQKHELVVAR
jgi:glycosyltransferase involved in cell wall biosynthesis